MAGALTCARQSGSLNMNPRHIHHYAQPHAPPPPIMPFALPSLGLVFNIGSESLQHCSVWAQELVRQALSVACP